MLRKLAVDLSISRLFVSTRSRVLSVLAVTLVAGLCVPVAPARGQRPAEPVVSCEACFVIDDTGRVLWARAAATRLPNASTTKMVTALEVMESVTDPQETVTVSSTAASIGGGGHDLQAGDQITVRNLLFAMLLSSSNESAAALAEHVGGTQDAFVRRMNVRARRLGATDTHFANPHGFDADGHYSTAADLATIGAALLAEPYLRRIVGTPAAVIETPRGPVEEVNRNVLLESYRGAVGIKTGRTLGAGNVLVAAARRGDRRIIAVAMRAVDAAADARALLDYGFARARRLDRPRSLTVLESRTSFGTLIFDPYGAVEIVAGDPVTLDLVGKEGPFEYSFEPLDITPPLRPGQKVGTISVTSEGATLAEVDALVVDPVAEEDDGFGPRFLGAVLEVVAAAVSSIT